MAQKLSISKPGVTVGTASTPNDFIFSSDYNTLKYQTDGSIVMNVVTADFDFYTRSGTVDHDLGYYPFVQVWVTDENRTDWSPVGAYRVGAGDYHNDFAYTGTKSIFFQVEGFSNTLGTIQVTFAYKIFKNNLNL